MWVMATSTVFSMYNVKPCWSPYPKNPYYSKLFKPRVTHSLFLDIGQAVSDAVLVNPC